MPPSHSLLPLSIPAILVVMSLSTSKAVVAFRVATYPPSLRLWNTDLGSATQAHVSLRVQFEQNDRYRRCRRDRAVVAGGHPSPSSAARLHRASPRCAVCWAGVALIEEHSLGHPGSTVPHCIIPRLVFRARVIRFVQYPLSGISERFRQVFRVWCAVTLVVLVYTTASKASVLHARGASYLARRTVEAEETEFTIRSCGRHEIYSGVEQTQTFNHNRATGMECLLDTAATCLPPTRTPHNNTPIHRVLQLIRLFHVLYESARVKP